MEWKLTSEELPEHGQEVVIGYSYKGNSFHYIATLERVRMVNINGDDTYRDRWIAIDPEEEECTYQYDLSVIPYWTPIPEFPELKAPEPIVA